MARIGAGSADAPGSEPPTMYGSAARDRRLLVVGIVVLLVLPLVATVGCGGAREGGQPTAGDDEAARLPAQALSPEEIQRRTALRDSLRAELGEAYDEPVPPADDPASALAHGKKVFDAYCSPCHGDDGRGTGETGETLDVQPADLTDPAKAAFYSDRATLEIIRRGVPDTPMIGWQDMIDDDELMDVFRYVRSISGSASVSGGGEAAGTDR